MCCFTFLDSGFLGPKCKLFEEIPIIFEISWTGNGRNL